jgi:signal peptidase I
MALLIVYFMVLFLATLFLAPLLFAFACRILKADKKIKFQGYFKTGLYFFLIGIAAAFLAAFIVIGLRAIEVKIPWLEATLHILFWIGLGIWIVSKNLKWDWTKGVLALMGFIGIFFLTLLPVRYVTGIFAKVYSIPSGSMEDTIKVDDWMLIDRLYYGHSFFNKTPRYFASHKPQRGEIVVFRIPLDISKVSVKRCVGVPGDILLYKDKVLYVNGRKQAEPYVKHIFPSIDSGYLHEGMYGSRDNFGPVTVQPGHYFMMGDNRDNSLDSRYWGTLDEKLILGKAICIFLRKSEDKFLYQPLP